MLHFWYLLILVKSVDYDLSVNKLMTINCGNKELLSSLRSVGVKVIATTR